MSVVTKGHQLKSLPRAGAGLAQCFQHLHIFLNLSAKFFFSVQGEIFAVIA